MADYITGHITTLPGTEHPVPPGQCCDKHPHDLATHRIQGDTDALSAELHDMCDFCYARYLNQEEDSGGECDWCHNYSDCLKDYRDITEGLMGEIHQVCPRCIKEDQDRVVDDVPPEIEDSAFGNGDDGDVDPDSYLPHDD